MFTPDQPQANYGGMTVNERLVVSRLMDEFDAAARRRDRDTMIGILRKVALTEKGAAQTADGILADRLLLPLLSLEPSAPLVARGTGLTRE